MLNGLRKNTKVIVWSVILAFVLWGGFSVGTQFQKQGRIAGEVFGKPVSFQEYNLFFRSQQLFTFGNPPSEDPAQLKQQAWEKIVMSREAKRLGIEVEDSEVRAEVLRLLAQQKIENPTIEIYTRWLKAAVRETPAEFESQIRELLRTQKLIRKVQLESGAKPATEQEAHERFSREQSQVAADLISFKTEDEAKKFLAVVKNAADWKKQAEKQKLAVFPKGLTSLAAWVELQGLTEADTQAMLKAEKETILGPFSQAKEFILLKITDKKNAPEEDFQKTWKDKYLEQINNQRSFEAFNIWHQALLVRAKYKDYMPS